MKAKCKVPDDFDAMCQAEIEEMFYGSPIEAREDEAESQSKEARRKP